MPTLPSRSLARRVVLFGRSMLAWRFSWRWLRGVVRAFITSFLALSVTLWLLPGTQVTAGTTSVARLALAVLIISALLRPFLVLLTVLTGAVGLLLAGLLTQALVLGLALASVPTADPFSAGELFIAAWAATAVSAVINWLFDSSSDEAFLGQVLGRAVQVAHRHPAGGSGLLVVQLDGVSAPLLRQAMTSGAMPNVTRWIRSGGYRLREWHTGLPATTPAGQAVLLHGDARAVPGFRWYDKDRGRILVCSRPADIALVEAELSTGRGLLADGGVSVSNLFSGDAPTRVLTMSHARIPSEQRGAASFFASRNGFGRSLVLFIGQIVTEWFQGRRQRRRDVLPRIRRGGAFLFLRGLTTVILRDLNVSVVCDQMARGAPVLYVDFVDYDEVAHHAGPSRPEAMRTLENLDQIVGFLATVAREVGRDYELVVVSDHGQAQGGTFEQLAGCTLGDVVDELVAAPVRSPGTGPEGKDGESWARANLLRSGGTGTGRMISRAAETAAAGGSGRTADPDHPDEPVLVLSSGSLAHIYLTQEPGRVGRERIDALHPALVSGLARHPQVGVVITRRDDGTVVADGADGWRVVTASGTQDGEGEDPLRHYGRNAAADVAGLDAKAHVGDVILLGRFDPELGEVAAFEELVGSHGGLGGWQTRALMVHPSDWDLPGVLDGTAVHRALIDRLTVLGLRSNEVAVQAESIGAE